MKPKSFFFVGLAIFVLLTAAIAGYSGMLTGRWETPRAVIDAREDLKKLPLTIGDWTADKDSELDAASVAMLEIKDSYISRTYKNSITQEVVYVSIILGPSGRVTVHTPQICFGGKDYTLEKDKIAAVPITVQIDNGAKTVEDSFWRVNFVGNSLETNNRITFYYAHSLGDVWSAMDNARWILSKSRYAYKIQVQAYAPNTEDSLTDPVKDFLKGTLPVIHEHLTLSKSK